jgi:hypothetical protein
VPDASIEPTRGIARHRSHRSLYREGESTYRRLSYLILL